MSGSALGRVVVEDLDRHRLFVGWCGDEPVDAIVVTDANGLFGLTVDLVRLMQLPGLVPPMLVLGVGYASAETITDTIASRVADLTPTAVAGFTGSGGADAFRTFLRSTALPRLAQVAPSVRRTTYFGHSLGGLFGVHDLLAAERLFDRHIISSPSLWWDRHALLRVEIGPLAGDVFFCIGGDETDEGRRREAAALADDHPFKPPAVHLDMVDDLVRFTSTLSARAGDDLRMAVEVVPGEFHATLPPIALSRGLRWLHPLPTESSQD